jgi:monoamine oxidase
MDRRTMIAAVGSLPLTAALGGCAAARTQRVVIVGAGIAGLGAARLLADQGQAVTLVEARGRIGGRVETSSLWPDMPVDMGASWIHGAAGNPLTALAREAGAATAETRYDRTQLYIDPALRAQGVSDEGYGWASALVKKARVRAEDADSDSSLRAAIDAVLPPRQRTAAHNAQLNFYLSSAIEQEYAASADQLSVWHYDEIVDFGGPELLFPRGYDAIARHLARGLDIRLNWPVVAIRHDDRGVVVQSASGETLAADWVIVTVPLGVLKAGQIIFDPAPTPRWQAATRRLAMGLLNKLWLRFDRLFWPDDKDWLQLLKPDPLRWSEWVSFAGVAGQPLLVGFTAADAARAVEQLPDAAIVAEAMAVLRTMLGSAVPEPMGWQISRWASDRFALGAYSYYPVGSSVEDRRALAESGSERLLFAGEACSADYPSTVHGALLSGQAAARRVLS